MQCTNYYNLPWNCSSFPIPGIANHFLSIDGTTFGVLCEADGHGSCLGVAAVVIILSLIAVVITRWRALSG